MPAFNPDSMNEVEGGLPVDKVRNFASILRLPNASDNDIAKFFCSMFTLEFKTKIGEDRGVTKTQVGVLPMEARAALQQQNFTEDELNKLRRVFENKKDFIEDAIHTSPQIFFEALKENITAQADRNHASEFISVLNNPGSTDEAIKEKFIKLYRTVGEGDRAKPMLPSEVKDILQYSDITKEAFDKLRHVLNTHIVNNTSNFDYYVHFCQESGIADSKELSKRSGVVPIPKRPQSRPTQSTQQPVAKSDPKKDQEKVTAFIKELRNPTREMEVNGRIMRLEETTWLSRMLVQLYSVGTDAKGKPTYTLSDEVKKGLQNGKLGKKDYERIQKMFIQHAKSPGSLVGDRVGVSDISIENGALEKAYATFLQQSGLDSKLAKHRVTGTSTMMFEHRSPETVKTIRDKLDALDKSLFDYMQSNQGQRKRVDNASRIKKEIVNLRYRLNTQQTPGDIAKLNEDILKFLKEEQNKIKHHFSISGQFTALLDKHIKNFQHIGEREQESEKKKM
jgi:hypothetical protein